MASKFTTATVVAAREAIAQHGDFELTGSVDSARRYLAALTTLIPLLPMRHQFGGGDGESIAWSLADLMRMRDTVSKWLASREQLQRGRVSKVRFCRYRT